MALAGQRKISLSQMEQKINVTRRLGRKPTLDELEFFAQEAIERINDRTLNGEDINGSSFTPYSEDYAEKKGVGINDVDLFLDGDMLSSLDYEIDERSGTVTIKVLGDLQVKKGYNHHVGDTLPKRSWFGVTTDETELLIAQLDTEITESTTLSDLFAAVESLGLDVELD
jgi:hypothetical protein